MTAAVLDREHYQAYWDEMCAHGCEALALSYEQWCTACKEAR
jgi:hypothetical protein